MPLHLVELQPPESDRAAVGALVDRVAGVLRAHGAELIEAHVPAGLDRVFLITEASRGEVVGESFVAAGIEFEDIAEVRLVGAELAEVKALSGRRPARYLVEWDLPDGLTMDSYLARKKEKAPLYASVPETTFLRTYVREDLDKCLCLYDAPDETAVKRAREAVGAPIDRLHDLQASP